jgi:hypothetical protein
MTETSRRNASAGIIDEYLIKRRRPRFDAILSNLHCEEDEHRDFENVITINLSPEEYFVIDKVCFQAFASKVEGMLLTSLNIKQKIS